MMRAPAIAALLFAFLATASSESAFASFLRIVPQCDVMVDSKSSTVRAAWIVKNDGDEPAKDVAIDIPALNEGHAVSKDLGAGQTARVDVEIPFASLQIKESGTYALAYRVTYKDLNFHPSSAPYVAEVVLPPAAAQALVIRFDEGDSGGSKLARTGRLRFKARNASDRALTVASLDPSFPLELAAKVDAKTPIKLGPGDETSGLIEITNSGALPGSTYGVGIIASGVSGDRHFTASGSVSLEIVEESLSPSILLQALILSAAVIVAAAWLLKRRGRPIS